MDGMGVKVMIVLAGAKGSIFLGDKEKGEGLWGFRWDDATHFEVFYNKCSTGFLLFGIEGVYFGDFGYKCVLQVNGMIKGSVGR